ncbi:RHS repeat-associated core domain-containing protein [Usitatibacter palustris]|uniref:RHS repeat-associated core domain-containing protein n=1 Tax=Usitatibacter palustris TaxID=2732487 RepID=UPI001487A194
MWTRTTTSRSEYNYFRDYDPRIGRYVESDPVGLNGGLNTYGYVGASPLVFLDEFGLACRTTILIRDQWDAAGDQNIMTEKSWRTPKWSWELNGLSICVRYVGDTVFTVEMYRNVQFWQLNRTSKTCSTCTPCGGEGSLTCSDWSKPTPIDAKEVTSGPWFRSRTSFEERAGSDCVKVRKKPPGRT